MGSAVFKVSLLIQLFAVICAVLLTSGAYAAATSHSHRTRAPSRGRPCSRNTPCVWAVCEWAQYVTVNARDCMFIPSGCVCTPGKRCMRTDDVTPSNGFLTVTYTCQDYAEE